MTNDELIVMWRDRAEKEAEAALAEAQADALYPAGRADD